MVSSEDPKWLANRLKERAAKRKEQRLSNRAPGTIAIDASRFSNQISELALTITLKIEREIAPRSQSTMPSDIGIILRYLTQVYDLLRLINSDEMRFESAAYRTSYSFVSLPLVRTMIDGLYNSMMMIHDPSSSRKFRIAGYFRQREAIKNDEEKCKSSPVWNDYLLQRKQTLIEQIKQDGITNSDLDDKSNKWPLLSEYLKNSTGAPHDVFLKQLTLGYWQEYSSLSHSSFAGLLSIFPFIAPDWVQSDDRAKMADAGERHTAMHLCRAAGLLLCLLTEIQHHYKFNDAGIDARLQALWTELVQAPEVGELYTARYKNFMRGWEINL